MLGRRSFVSMLGLAPVAATIKPAQVAVEQTTSAAWTEVGKMAYSVVGTDESGKDRLKEVADMYSREYKGLKWTIENGFFESDRKYYEPCKCIESRKATSPAIKALLQEERSIRQELDRAMLRRKRAVAKAIAPPWIRPLFENRTSRYD